ncbi:MAG: ATPase domain-containing protein [Candidatus Bathyarchaeota archaeon]
MEQIRRSPTGIENLDNLIQGGIPLDSYLLLITDPRTFAELFIRDFVRGGLENNEGVIFCTILRPPESVRNDFKYTGFDLAQYEEKGQLIFVNIYGGECSGNNVLCTDSINHVELSATINKAIGMLKNFDAKRAVCDSTGDALFTLDLKSVTRFAQSRRVIQRQEKMVCLHTVIRGIRDDFTNILQQHSDAVFEIDTTKTPQGIHNLFRISKMRYTEYLTKQYAIEISENRLKIAIEK